MAHVHILKDKTRKMRSRGASFNAITAALNLPKSTIRYWCRNIILSEYQQQKLHARQKLGGIRAAEKRRRVRITLTKNLLKEGKNEIGNATKKEKLIAGAALYWAEGYRKGDGEFGFTNSDPQMIKFIIRWLQKICGVGKERIFLRVCINAIHENRIKSITEFWSKTTGIPSTQFTRPTFINVKTRKSYANQKEYFGTLRVKVRNSTNLRRKIMGWIQGLANKNF